MDTIKIASEEWEHVLSFMPKSMEKSCRIKFAIRRNRQITSASDLLRLCFAYGLCDMSLRQVAAWASTIGMGDLSDVAVLKRLKGASEWLGYVVARWLFERGLTTNVPGYNVRIIDATTVSKPGSKGVDWRLHVSFDLDKQQMSSVKLTDQHEGESLKRHKVNPGEVFLVDRGYAHASGIGHVLKHGGHVVMRGHWHNLPLYTRGGKRIDIIALLGILGSSEIADWPVYLKDEGHLYPMRLVAVKKTEAATEKERKHIRLESSKKMHRVSSGALQAAAYIYVLTDISSEEISPIQVLELYRLRWQIELFFKRLKSILKLENLRAKDAQLSRTYIMSKILGSLLIEEMTGDALSFFPWGFRLFDEAAQPMANDSALA